MLYFKHFNAKIQKSTDNKTNNGQTRSKEVFKLNRLNYGQTI